MHVTANAYVELEIALEGTWVPYRVVAFGDPPEGGYAEDVTITDLLISVRDDYRSGLPTYTPVSLLNGVDTTSPAVQRLLENLLDAIHASAQEALAEEANP